MKIASARPFCGACCWYTTHSWGSRSGGRDDLIDAGVIETRDTQPLASILLGAFNEAGVLIAGSRDKAAAREGAAETFQYPLERLRVD